MTKRSWEELQQHLQPYLDSMFDIDRSKIHLNAMIVAAPPRPVRNEIKKHREGMEDDPAGYVLQKIRGEGPTRAVREGGEFADWAARYLGLQELLLKRGLIPGDVIAQTTSTTMGLGLLANGINAKAGQEVLLSIHEFFSSSDAWKFRATRSGLNYREIRLYRDPTDKDLEDRICDKIEEEIRETTRVLALTWVDSGTGVKLPVKRIGAHVRKVNARRAPADRILFVLDAVHGFGVENQSFEDLECDFFVAGCHKWIFGPRGTGIICALPEAWAEVTPTIPSFLSAKHPGFLHSPGGVSTYEHVWAVSAAFKFLLDIGKDAIEQHSVTLAQFLKQGLSSIKDVHVITPASRALSSAIVCCAVPDADDAELKLRQLGVLATKSHDADRNPFLRFSPSILNDERQIVRALEAVAEVVGG